MRPKSDLFEDLPQPGGCWVSRRKARVVTAVLDGEINLMDACRRYQLSSEEFNSWVAAYEKHGVAGLRATRVQIYRDTAG